MTTPSLSLPNLAIRESLKQFVTVELCNGSLLRGQLVGMDVETGNVTLEDVRRRAKDLSISYCGRVFCRGSEVKLIQLPSVVQGAKFLKEAATLIKTHQKTVKRERKEMEKKVAKAAAKREKKTNPSAAASKKLLKKK